jgi:hypothetical protein
MSVGRTVSRMEARQRRDLLAGLGYLLLIAFVFGGTWMFLQKTQNCTTETVTFTDDLDREVTVSNRNCRQIWEQFS